MENNLEKVLVCVEDVELDAHVIEYTHMIARIVGLRSVHLLHVIHDTPGEARISRTSEVEGMSGLDLDREYKEEIERLTRGYATAMRESALKHFGDMDGVDRHIVVKVGNQLRDMLTIAHERGIDLIVMGRHLGARLEKGDAALTARRVARKSTCSVLVIPEDFEPRLTRILCPVRDSKCSVLALQTAVDLGVAFDADIHAVNLFQVYNDTYYPVGTSEPKSAHDKKIETAQFFADRECEALKRKIDFKSATVHFDCLPDETFRAAEQFQDVVSEKDCDLVVIGARGRTGAAGVLLGTITEQLIRQSHVPILATKHKGEHIGILKAMLALFGRE